MQFDIRQVSPSTSPAPSRHPLSSALREPSSTHQIQEHDQIAPVDHHELEVATAQRPAGPPAVLHHPVLVDGLNARATDPVGHAARPRAHSGATRSAEAMQAAHRRRSSDDSAGNGASTARRSGSRESGSIARTRKAASEPAACLAWRTASPMRSRRDSTDPRSSRSRACSRAGGPNASTSTAIDSAGAGSSLSLGVRTMRCRSGSALACRKVTGVRHVPPSTNRADSASDRSDRPAARAAPAAAR